MTGKVAIITGGSQGIGAGLVAGYRARGWAVVASARTIRPSRDPDVLTVSGDIAGPVTADRIVSAALERFGRVDTLVNNAGVFISKPFTDYTAQDYATIVGVNLTGFFWLTQRAITEKVNRYGGHVISISATLADVAESSTPAVLTALVVVESIVRQAGRRHQLTEVVIGLGEAARHAEIREHGQRRA